jgi:tetratricopeptide (TPR) repeat protein/transcriptional regulator with XRE-family HTH domain
VTEPGLSFARLLRQLRTERRLTQEELAEAAGLSPRSVSDLERGINRTARKDTAILLAGALNLTGPVQAAFVAAARGRAPAGEVLAAMNAAAASGPPAAATRTLPRDIGSFTGREADLARLLQTLTDGAGGGTVAIHAIDGMAGIGKTTFAVHAAHALAVRFPDGQFFLPLHGHAPGQQPVDAADALTSLLLAAGVAPQQIPPGTEARAARWRDQVAGKRTLLVLDDATGHEQVRPLLPGTAGSLVLITSRRRLTALEDARVLTLDTLAPDDAAALLARLAGRADVVPDADASREIARLCGYLPLAIGMVAGQLRHHPARSAARLAADLTAARDRLAVMRAENLSVAAAFDLSYQDLNPDQQRLFGRLGLAPGPDIDAYGAAALDQTSAEAARLRLDELYEHHLITEPSPGRYLLHDLIRAYSRTLAAVDPGDSAAAARLMNYYAHVASAAGQYIATWTTAGRRPAPGRPPASAPAMNSRAEAVAWLEDERANLHAAVSFAAATMPADAIAIATAIGGFLRARGHWDQAMAQYQAALSAARRAGDRAGEAGALDELGLLHQLTAEYATATATLAEAAALYQQLGDRPGEAYALNHLGLVQQELGEYQAAAASHRQALALARDAADLLAEAVSLANLGMVQQRTGEYEPAAADYERALALFRGLGSEFDEADALCGLGVVRRLTGDYAAAADSHHQALELFRRIGDRLGQGWVLDELGRVQQLTGDYETADASLAEAVELFRSLGSLEGLAEALNSRGELAAHTSAMADARRYHGEALAIAREIGARPEEARALAGTGVSLLPDSPAEAAGLLRSALAIYQRLESPEVQRVQDALDRLGG